MRGSAKLAKLFSGCLQVLIHSNKSTTSESETISRDCLARKIVVSCSDTLSLSLLLYKPLCFFTKELYLCTQILSCIFTKVSVNAESPFCISAQFFYLIVETVTFQGMQVPYFSE